MSELNVNAEGKITAYVGPDAINLMRAKTLMLGLRTHIRTGGAMRITRNASPTALLKMASEYSGKTYKRGQYQAALDDVEKWAKTMEAALPVVQR
jgi:hypothetical protein